MAQPKRGAGKKDKAAGERDAHRAREQHAEYLRKLGAHAIAVDEVPQKRGKTFAVIASFERRPPKVPPTLEVRQGKTTTQVPLVARVAPKFKAE